MRVGGSPPASCGSGGGEAPPEKLFFYRINLFACFKMAQFDPLDFNVSLNVYKKENADSLALFRHSRPISLILVLKPLNKAQIAMLLPFSFKYSFIVPTYKSNCCANICSGCFRRGLY